MQAYIKEIMPVKIEWSDALCLAVYFSGSNFKCGWLPDLNLTTINNELFAKDIKDIRKEIEIQAQGIETIMFTGGEPCLQKQALFALAAFVKEKNLQLGLETNGTKPEIIKTLLHGNLLDFIIINFNCQFDSLLFEKMTKSKSFFITSEIIMDEIKKTLAALKETTIPIEIRTTIIPGLLYRKEDILEIAKCIRGIDAVWKLKKFDNVSKLVDSKYQHLLPPSDQFLEDIKEACLKTYPELRIEIMQEMPQPAL